MDNQLLVSTSPHIRSPESIERIMWTVVFALIWPGLAGLLLFGYYVLFVIALSVGTAVATEALIQKLTGQEVTVRDGSAVLTGLLLAYVLPPNVPWYVPIVGSFVAIALAKQVFGGLGNNIWNPALVGRAFVQVAYPTKVSLANWPIARKLPGLFANILDAGSEATCDAISGASPLAKTVPADAAFDLFGQGAGSAYLKLFLGNVGGCIGETCALLLIVGGIYLIWRGYVDWRMPVCYIGTIFVLAWILPSGRIQTEWANNPIYHVLAGGVMLGAFFMATDMVTTPLSKKGLVVFGICGGALVVLIRFYTGYPEGVCYSILLMNTATPLIDRYTRPKVYGSKRETKK